MGKIAFFVMTLLLLGGHKALSLASGNTGTGAGSNTTTFLQLPANAPKENNDGINQPRVSIYFDVMGWLGTFFYILAYLLLTLRKIRSQQKIYHVLNILGALGLIANAVHLRDMPSLVVNAVWFGIGLTAVGWMLWGKKEKIS